ncbi:MAG: type II secretion system minor pseudopilin GspK [Steroidobacteraceae bacterium]
MKTLLHIRRQRERGIALLTALILVAIATALATAIGFRSALSARRAIGTFTVAQGLQYAAGAEAIAAYALKQDELNTSSKVDSLDEDWAMPYGPTELDSGVTLEASLEDEQGKFNINNLVDLNGVADTNAQAVFTRLLELLGMETKWSALLTDWIDTDVNPTLPDGAEDSSYAGQLPPYRTPNLRISSISELLALPGFGHDNYEKIKPYITALPGIRPINVCTAPGMVLDALSVDQQEYSLDTDALAKRRASGCFPTLAELKTSLGDTQYEKLTDGDYPLIAETSSYFRLRSWITIGTTQFTLYSLMYRANNGTTRPILRTFGTE